MILHVLINLTDDSYDFEEKTERKDTCFVYSHGNIVNDSSIICKRRYCY